MRCHSSTIQTSMTLKIDSWIVKGEVTLPKMITVALLVSGSVNCSLALCRLSSPLPSSFTGIQEQAHTGLTHESPPMVMKT